MRPNDQITVLVANGTNVTGAAGRLTDQLADQGHPTLTPLSTRPYSASEIWFSADFGPEAAALADRLGVFPENVSIVPDDADFDTTGSDLIVIIGPDLAGS